MTANLMTAVLRNERVNRRDRVLITALVSACAGGLLLGPPARADWQQLVATPHYQQLQNNWCGPATAKMIIESGPVNGTVRTQAQHWADVGMHNAEPAAFSTDPVAMEWVIENYDTRGEPPPQNRWIIDSQTDVKKAAGKLAQTIDLYGTPSATLINRGDHWVTVTGVRTSQRPRDGAFTVQRIWLNDPWFNQKMGRGQVVSYETWAKSYQTANRWGTTYANKFVSVVDPDPAPENVQDYVRPGAGGAMSEAEAIQVAQSMVSQEGLSEHLGGYTPSIAELVNISQTDDQGYWVGFTDGFGMVHGGILIDSDQRDFLISGWVDSPGDAFTWGERQDNWPYLGDRVPTNSFTADTSALFYVSPVPEPASVLMIVLGAFCGLRRRRAA